MNINFFLARILQGIGVLWGVASVIFLLFLVMPANPTSVLLGDNADKETRQKLITEWGLDKPIYVQYTQYLNDLLPIAFHEKNNLENNNYRYITLISLGENAFVLKYPHFRRSYLTGKLVNEILWEALWGTLILAVSAMFLATIFGIQIGIFASQNQDNFLDKAIMGISALGIATPSFVSAMILAVFLGFWWGNVTGLQMTGSLWELDTLSGEYHLKLKNLILPALTLSVRPLAIITQLTRSSMLEVMQQDYIRTARAKGLSERKILYTHALRNALNPVITAISGWLASLMAGAFFVEYIFAWKGLGRVTLEASRDFDLPVVMGATLLMAFIFVCINVLVDVLYGVFDPRMRT